MPYNDLREFLEVLERNELLRHVSVPVERVGEISHVMRWIYRGYAEESRYAVMFDNVKGYDIPVVVGVIGASYKTYALGLEIDPRGPKREVMRKIKDRWIKALDNPIKPKVIPKDKASCKENILMGRNVDIHKFPIPVWTLEKDKGWDKGFGFITSPYVVTKDPETRIQNMGTYRCMITEKPDEITVCTTIGMQHIGLIWDKYNHENKRMPIAVVIGADPSIGMTSVTKVPLGVDEFDISGGLRGTPVELVKCETSDLLVPATAEIIIEGETFPEKERPFMYEAPFGEYLGFQGSAHLNPVTKIHCITFRNKPIYQAFISQMPPSESSKVRHLSHEPLLLRQLRSMGIPKVIDVYQPESGQTGITIVQISKVSEAHPKQVANAVFSMLGKFVIVVEEDVDIYDWDDVMWNVAFKTKLTPTEKDIHFVPAAPQGLDYSVAPSMKEFKERRHWPACGVFIDATRPFYPYPVTSLPPAKYLKMTRDGWREYGLPPLEKTDMPPCIEMEDMLLKLGKVEKPEIL